MVVRSVSRHDEVLLERFLLARRARDVPAAEAAWRELVELNFDRVVAFVRLEGRGRLSPAEQQDAVQQALVRMLTGLARTFRGTTVAEWVAATRRLVHFACADVARRAARHSRCSVELGPEHDVAEPADDDDPMADGRAFLAWAVPRLPGRRREVVELDLQELTTEQIMARLGVSRDVVYAARSRALKDLDKLRGEYEAA